MSAGPTTNGVTRQSIVKIRRAERLERFDLEQPTRDSIEFFYPRMDPGAVILLDDHGSAMCPGARKTALEFFADRGEMVLDLATGQGLVIKQGARHRNSG